MSKSKVKKVSKKKPVRMPGKDGLVGRKPKAEGEKKEPLRLFVTPNSVKEKGGEQHVKQELMKKFDSLPKLI